MAPWLTVLGAVGLAGVALWYTTTTLEFETSRNSLVSSSQRYVQIEDELDKEFDRVSYLLVVVDTPQPELGKQFVEALATRLRRDTQHIREVIEKIDTHGLEGKKLLYLSPEELRKLRQRLEDNQDFLIDLAAAPGLERLLTVINRKIATALVGAIAGGLLQADTSKTSAATSSADSSMDVSFLTALFTEMERVVATPQTYVYRSPWGRFFLDDEDAFAQEGYLTSEHDRLFFVLVDGVMTKNSFVEAAATLHVVREHLRALRQDFPQIRAGVTGEEALNTDEMLAAQRDTLWATVIAFIGVAALYVSTFRQVWQPMLAVLALLIAVCWTLGFTTLVVGHLNILTIAFVPILIGLGIDFSIHLVARYGEERANQHDFQTAMKAALEHTGSGIITAALTTAVAFYAVMLTNLQGLIELGLIAGSGLLLCLLASLVVLPAMLALRERHKRPPVGIWQSQSPNAWHRLLPFPRTLLSVIVLLTAAGALLLPTPQFDYNLLHLQAQGTESVIWEHRLLKGSDRSSLHVITVADSLEALHRKQEQFSALPGVSHVESLASVIPDNQDVRLPLVQALAPYVENLSVDWTALKPIDRDALHLLLRKIRFKLQRGASEWDSSQRPAEAQLTAARTALLALQTRLRTTPPEVANNALAAFQRALMQDFADKLRTLRRNVNPTPITRADIPTYLQQRFISNRGRYLLQVFARKPMWDYEAMQDFLAQVQTVDANVTGGPLIAHYSIQQIQQGYARGGVYALVVVIGIVVLLFRRPKPVVLALIPLIFGGLWTMASMALVGLQLNLANLIIVPLFLGIAVDNGIHLVHRWQEEPQAVLAPLARSTGKAIVLTSLTTMVGFGSLMVARHTGIFSLGLLTTISMGCSLIATLVVLPLAARCLPVGK
jgi:hopanoid biosynthesis associated RND transporter like protein HpnN